MRSDMVSRREFIHKSLVAGEAAALTILGGTVLAEGLPLITEKHRDGEPYKIGILGCGNRSRAHIGALNGVPEIEIAALCDIVPHKMDQRARLIQNGPDPRRYTDLEKMVAQEDLDAVAVVLPNYLHKMGAIAALEAGKHVFCEKPMALTVPDCNEMIAVAERQRKAIQVGTQRRHSKAYQDVIEIFRGAYLGRILSSDINSYRGDWRTPAEDEYPPGVEYWRLNQAQSGGVVYEMGAHIIDVNNWILDSEPVTVVSLQGVNNPILPERDSMDHAGVLVRYANGALTNYGGNLYAHGSVAPNFYYSVNGTTRLTDDRIEVNYRPGSGARSGEPLDMELPRGDGTVDQWKYFVRVLAGEAPPYPDGPAARQTIQICQASVISAQERTVVQVSDLG